MQTPNYLTLGGRKVSSEVPAQKFWSYKDGITTFIYCKKIPHQKCEIVKKKPNFLELGVNIGTVFVPMAIYVQRFGGKAIGIEAMIETYTMARTNLHINSISNALVVFGAVGNTSNKNTHVYSQFGNMGGAFIHNGSFDGIEDSMTKTRTLKLDEIFELIPDEMCKVSVAKMDIQGYEGAALFGGEKWLRTCPPCFILSELQKGMNGQTGVSFEKLFAFLRDIGYEVYKQGENLPFEGNEDNIPGRNWYSHDDFEFKHTTCQ